MNKTFKILWNRARGQFVVSSENHVTVGGGKKSSSLVLSATAIAVASVLGASAVNATVIDNNYVISQEKTTKFISGNNGQLNIQTNGNAKKLLEAIASKDLNTILAALGTGDGVTLVGATGGKTFVDKDTYNTIGLVGALKPELQPKIEQILSNLEVRDSDVSAIKQDISITIGAKDKSSSPLVVATVGGDRLINANININGNDIDKEFDLTSTRVGDVTINMNSGNSFFMTGASSAINVGHAIDAKVTKDFLGIPITVSVNPNAKSTTVILDGNTNINISGSSSSLGTLGGGSAIAIGGIANSTVKGSTNITVNTDTNGVGYEGINAGLFGGGLAIGTFGGTANTSVGSTNIDIQKGVSGFIVGGGLAVAGDVHERLEGLIPSKLPGNATITLNPEALGGNAHTISGDIEIHLGSKASTAMVMGGGIAIAYQPDDIKVPAEASSTVGNVTITIGKKDAAPVFASVEEKAAYFKAIKEGLTSIQTWDGLTGFINTVANQPGVNVAVMGGGLATSWSRNYQYGDTEALSQPQATSSVESATINILSGYNVGVLGGGLALASGDATGPVTEKPSATLAESTVGTVNLSVAGGETIGLIGGGMALAGGTGDVNYGQSAKASVGTVNIGVVGGSVDGIIGGGIAIDDVNPKINQQYENAQNAVSSVENVNIVATSGSINRLSFEAFFGNNQMPPLEHPAPNQRDYLDSITYAMMHGDTAIVGGGISSGLADPNAKLGNSHVDNVLIALGGDVVVGSESSRGNIYGGGIATEGALATVTNSTIQIGDTSKTSGPTINGDIYGGGIALQAQYTQDIYNTTRSTVESSNIILISGTVNGDIYASGRVIKDAKDTKELASVEVKNSNIEIHNPTVFKGKLIDGSNAGVADGTISSLKLFNGEYTIETVKGFKNIQSNDVVNIGTYNFADKETTHFAGLFNLDTINAGSTKAKSTLVVDNGVTAIKNPVWTSIGYTVANEGILAVGSQADAQQTSIDLVGKQPALYIDGKVDLSNANILVGTTDKANGVHLGADATIAFNAANHSRITNGTVQGTKSTLIYVTHVQDKGASLKTGDVLQGFSSDNLILDNMRYEAQFDKQNEQWIFGHVTDAGKLADMGLDGFDSNALDIIETQEDDASMIVRGLLDQMNSSITSGEMRHTKLNVAFNVGTAAGVQTAGIEGALMTIDQATKRASLTNTFKDGWTGFAEVAGTQLELGGNHTMLETKTKLAGVTVGGEYTQGTWTAGIAANFGTGDVDGEGLNSGVKNDIDYYGIQFYGAKRIDNFNVVGQFGWLTTDNEVTSSLGDRADIDADVFSLGVRGEMNVAINDKVSMVPYVGLNFLRVSTDSYRTQAGFDVDSDDQNLFNVPLGVAVKADFATASGWHLQPMVDVAYVGTFGDTNVESDTAVGKATMGTDLDVWSQNVGRVRVGFEAQKDAFGIGFNLGGAAGTDDHREIFGQVSITYAF